MHVPAATENAEVEQAKAQSLSYVVLLAATLPSQDFSLALTLPLSTESCFSSACNLRSRTSKLKSPRVRCCSAVCSELPAQV
jgi:hypothetical protein